jgi:rapamycin-insensitive companion of mTOR
MSMMFLFQANLMSLVRLQPSVLHLGEKGAMLLARFVSVPQGFKFLLDSGLLNSELDKWRNGFNMKYVDIVEERLNEALTTYEKSHDGGYVRRSTCP